MIYNIVRARTLILLYIRNDGATNIPSLSRHCELAIFPSLRACDIPVIASLRSNPEAWFATGLLRSSQ